MKIIMRAYVHKEAKRVVRQENDVAMVETEFADMVISETTDDAETVIESRAPRVGFSEK